MFKNKNDINSATFKSNHKAFTLAEVLITLVVIGVIAAITVPSLIAQYQKQQTVTKVKKFFNTANGALSLAIKENGTVDNWDYQNFTKNSSRTSTDFANYLKKHMNIIKDCKDKSGCFYDGYYKKLNGSNYLRFDNDKAYDKFILSDGSHVFIRTSDASTNCGKDEAGYKKVCGFIHYDTNGKKGPNTYGKDFFYFAIMKDRIGPHLGDDCDSSISTNAGHSCASYIIKNGKMDY